MGGPEARKAAEAALRESIGPGADFDAVLAVMESHGAIERRPRLVFAAGLRVDSRGLDVWDIEHVHQHWRATDDSPRHPLAPLVAAWLDRPHEVAPFHPTKRASLPGIHLIEATDARELPGLPAHIVAPSPQLDLPGFEPVVSGCPSWLLWAFDAAGGESLSQGRGAPWPLRLFVGAMLQLPIQARNGRWTPLRFPTFDMARDEWMASFPDLQPDAFPDPVPGVASWLHPNGWTNRRRDWQQFPAALDAMRERLTYVPVAGFGDVAMMFPSVIPRDPSDPFVEFTIRIPGIAARGARLDWRLVRHYGTKSAALYRAYLSASAHLDQSARDGHPITAEIAAPVLDAEGKPKRRKGGGMVRSGHDTAPNPSARFVPFLTDADLARMTGFDPTDRFRRRDAREAFELLSADGVLDLQREGRGFRLFGPSRPLTDVSVARIVGRKRIRPKRSR